jgi:hypothetical protein
MKIGHLDSQEGWVCTVIGSSVLVTMNSFGLHPCSFLKKSCDVAPSDNHP